MSVRSDQSASCSSLHGALPHPRSQMHIGGNIIDAAGRSLVSEAGLNTIQGKTERDRQREERTREGTPVHKSNPFGNISF